MKKTAPPFVAILLLHALLAAPLAGRQATRDSVPSHSQPTQSQPAQSQSEPARQPSSSPQATPTPTPRARADSEDDVVRITSNLVQIDATVLDKDGRPVADLGPEDFEVLEDGEPQPITNFSYVSNEPSARAEAAPTKKSAAEGAAPPVPPARMRPGQVRRTVALVVDDLGTSFESMGLVRQALKKYVDEQMQPGDIAAVIRTSAGMGALQQFTADKQMLHRAIERVRWYPSGRAGVGAFTPMEADPFEQMRDQMPTQAQKSEEDKERERRQRERGSQEGLDEFREEIFSVGTLGALNFIIKGLREMPGRKSVILFSDGFEIQSSGGESTRVLEALRRLTDLANRASVVVYTIDARGLAYIGMTASDNTSGMTSAQIERSLSDRRATFFNTQDGMNYLAQQTGGFFVRNSNDLAGGVRRALDDQKGFYLLGYRPDAETFEPEKGRGRFNKVEVRVKRPGLKVRTRSGFYGFTEDERPVRRTRVEQLMAALGSPFGAGDVPLRLTSVFSSEGERLSFISSIMHIDASNLRFEEEADGWRKAVLDVIALTLGENGNVVDTINRTETIRARNESFESLRRFGLVYTMKLPIKKHGAYQLRVAVRDAATERVGSASQFVEVPNLSKNRLTLSGIVMMGTAHSPDATAAAGALRGQPDATPDPAESSAVRRFRAGSQIDYYLHIYNAKTDGANPRPQLQYQARIFRDGQPVFAGKLQDYDPGAQTDLKRLLAGGRVRLGATLTPGDYVFQIVVYDKLAKDKYRMASQWTDFEIVK